MDRTGEGVSDLITCGHGYFDIDIELLENARSAMEKFIAAKRGSVTDWSIRRESGGRVGILEQRSARATIAPKPHHAFCFAADLSFYKRPDDPHTKECLGVIEKLYRNLKVRATEIALELGRRFDTPDLSSRVRATFETKDSRMSELCMSSLGERLPASLLTFYLGGTAGDVWLQKPNSTEWFLASPPRGTALVFFGSEVTTLNESSLKPVHSKQERGNSECFQGDFLFVQAKELAADPVLANNVVALST